MSQETNSYTERIKMEQTLKTNPVEDGSNHLAHYGVKGMKWGVWNEETQRKYSGGLGRASNAMKAKLSKAGSSASGGARAVAAFSKRKMSAMGAKVNAMTSNSKAKREYKKAQKHEIAEQRKELGMSRAKFDKLREKTLKSHDPRVIERGMHTLTDAELNAKLDRLEREERVSKIATSKETRLANERKARQEAFNSNLLVKMGKSYADKYVNGKIDQILNGVGTNQVKKAEKYVSEKAKLEASMNTQNLLDTRSKNVGGASAKEAFKAYGTSAAKRLSEGENVAGLNSTQTVGKDYIKSRNLSSTSVKKYDSSKSKASSSLDSKVEEALKKAEESATVKNALKTYGYEEEPAKDKPKKKKK